MRYYLGIDIGTFESKGVIVNEKGRIVASASRPHKMLVPQPGWAEHRPKQDWWGDFTFICKKMLAESGIAPETIRAVGTSAIGPCMLPVDELPRLIARGAGETVYLIDVRTREEYAAGHIPGFWWMPGGQAVQRSDDTVAVRGGLVVFCCDGTVRATLTASWYRQMGFPNVCAVAGGTSAWTAAGTATRRSTGSGSPCCCTRRDR